MIDESSVVEVEMRLADALDLRLTSGNAPDSERDKDGGRPITQLTLGSSPSRRWDQLPGDTVDADLPGDDDYPDDDLRGDADSDDADSDDEQESDEEDE